jgi:hypothetical protein
VGAAAPGAAGGATDACVPKLLGPASISSGLATDAGAGANPPGLDGSARLGGTVAGGTVPGGSEAGALAETGEIAGGRLSGATVPGPAVMSMDTEGKLSGAGSLRAVAAGLRSPASAASRAA